MQGDRPPHWLIAIAQCGLWLVEASTFAVVNNHKRDRDRQRAETKELSLIWSEFCAKFALKWGSSISLLLTAQTMADHDHGSGSTSGLKAGSTIGRPMVHLHVCVWLLMLTICSWSQQEEDEDVEAGWIQEVWPSTLFIRSGSQVATRGKLCIHLDAHSSDVSLIMTIIGMSSHFDVAVVF